MYDPATCVSTSTTLKKLTHDGLARTYQLHVPASACRAGAAGRGAAVPMVVYLHCYGCPCSTSRGWEEESDARGAVLVKPCGDDLSGTPSWNAGACCGDAARDNRDDQGFIQAAVREVLATASRPAIDPDRMYLTGFSNGGFMTSVLARTSILFAAAAPVSGFEYTHAASPARPGGVRLQVHHGLLDGHVSIRGCCDAHRCCCDISSDDGNCTGLPEFAAKWSHINGCDDEVSAVTALLDTGTARRPNTTTTTTSSARMACVALPGCRRSTEVCVHADKHQYGLPPTPLTPCS